MKVLAFLCSYLAFLVSVEGIKFHLKPNTQKCLREELKKDVLIVGEFEVSPAPDQKVDYVVTDTKHAILAQNSDISKGKFSFVADSEDLYEICFTSKAFLKDRAIPQTITLDTKRGVEARTYENLAEAAKLKPMEVELKKLEKLSSAIVQDFVDMREREKLMRDTNESTNSRVLYLSIFSLVCLLGLALWQVTYLRRYFKAKKLIE